MKKILSFLFLFFSLSVALYAVPAYPGLITKTQPDGTTISYYMRGDENFHFMTSEDGYLVAFNADNILEYAEFNQDMQIVPVGLKVMNIANRTAKEKRYLKNALKASEMLNDLDVVAKRAQQHRAQRVQSEDNVPVQRYPLQGRPTSLVILVNFQNVEFTYPRESFDSLLNQKGYSANGGTGSANDFFEASSFGQFSPEFVIVGPYTLPQTMEYYGKNGAYGDANAQKFVIDACRLADEDGVDFSEYDTDGNGKVDNVFVYYAGYNEAEGGAESSIWPHRSAIVSTQEFDGVRLYDYACTSELKGNKGTTMCGIGTFCHEFGHVLGLPDFYVTDYGHEEPTLGSWDAMDNGPYNNGGKTPPAYSSYERFFLGWLTPIVLEKGVTEVEPLITSNTAYILSKEPHNMNGASPNPNEFFMIENRQHIGWDSVGLPGHGLLVTHIDYNKSSWLNNTPNNKADDMGAQIVCAAENTKMPEYNTFPGKSEVRTCFLTMKDGYQFPDPLTSIIEHDSTKVISFVYGETSTTPYISKNGDISYFNVPFGEVQNRVVEILGRNIVGKVEFKMQSGYHFMIKDADSDAGFSREFTIDVKEDSTFKCNVEIQYKPRRLSNGEIFEDKLIVESDNYIIYYDLSGEAPKAVKVYPPVAYEAKDITEKSFCAHWAHQEFATLYYLSVYEISNTKSVEIEGFDAFGSDEMTEGWTANFKETNRQQYGESRPSIYFKNETDTLWTKKYFFPINKVSFWVRSMNTIGVLHLDGLVNNEWVSLKTFDITAQVKGDIMEFELGDIECQQFKLYYEINTGTGGITFDDFTAECNKTANFKLEKYEAYDTAMVIGGLVEDRVYYYRVQASDKDEENPKIEENITDYSNEIKVVIEKQKAENDLKVSIATDGFVLVDLESAPKANYYLYIYTIEGQLVDVITPNEQEVVLPKLEDGKIYIIKYSEKDKVRRKDKVAKIFY